MKDSNLQFDRRSIRDYLKTAVLNNAEGAEFELELHERHLKSQTRKRNAKKKARKQARKSRKSNR